MELQSESTLHIVEIQKLFNWVLLLGIVDEDCNSPTSFQFVRIKLLSSDNEGCEIEFNIDINVS